MTSANHPRFRLLIGWCCLMTSALLIMTVYLATTKCQDKSSKTGNARASQTGNEEPNSTSLLVNANPTQPPNLKTNGKTDQQIDLPPGPSSNDYIRFIRDNEIWICDQCKDDSLSPKNSTVEILFSGLYYFHAQVTFRNVNTMPNPVIMPNPVTVTLRKNKTPGTQDRILSSVKQYGPGTANIFRVVELTKGDSISLEIEAINSISRQDSDTYWEMIFFNNK